MVATGTSGKQGGDASTNAFVALLIKSGVLSKDQALDAENLARQQNSTLAAALIKLGYATEEEVMRALAKTHRLPYVELDSLNIPERIIELMPESVARENVVLPLVLEDSSLTVAMSNPADVDTMDKLRFILNRDIRVALASRSKILEYINKMYGQIEGESADSILQE
ncbi:MAG: type II/IV secretion system protein, partial [Planctomycetota bacterium]